PDNEAIPPLAIFRLASTTVREAKDLPPDVPTQLYRAALEATAPSTALIKPILHQLHSRLARDEHYNLLSDESRFALLKLILNRNRNNNTMEIKTRLTTDTDDPAYNCGRLLAVLAAAQDKAHDYKLEGPGVAERYFGTASVSPASVFPLLLRLNRHHLNKISKSERFAGHERFLQEQIQNILSLFKPQQSGKPPAFPRTLDLQAQGRFALGFYQQAAEDHAARKAAMSGKPEPLAE
ncbi:MAG: type I-C CRISPR-associated protein Cas8c/Csd1, partial [Methylacidiphilales bacterium]|nr:type I-C CRISPR-associated protein Cas8c/Csd1 [Candidatus Methylacidiphilales bacterium]